LFSNSVTIELDSDNLVSKSDFAVLSLFISASAYSFSSFILSKFLVFSLKSSNFFLDSDRSSLVVLSLDEVFSNSLLF